jgi:hypothetical protein
MSTSEQSASEHKPRPAPGVARRAGRGEIYSYGEDRRCAMAGCDTKLSRYNSNPYCWTHEDPHRLRPQRGARES